MFTEKDLQQIKERGSDPEVVTRQLRRFEEGFPYLQIIHPAKAGNGVIRLNAEQQKRYADYYDQGIAKGLLPLKFVPASGAATRMFKDLYAFYNEAGQKGNPEMLLKERAHTQVNYFFDNLARFAFYPGLLATLGEKGTASVVEVLNHLLTDAGLQYGQLPKGLLTFHQYSDTTRTPFEEHLVEGASYSKDHQGNVTIHLTVSPQHRPLFEKLFQQVQQFFQQQLNVNFHISYSEQKPSTDTIATTPDNQPFRTKEGKLLFRPGGHGALIENLNDLDADLIFIKNIDNVAPDHLKEDTIRYKKALAGYLLDVRDKLYAYQTKLEKQFYYSLSSQFLSEVANFMEHTLNVKPPENLYYKSKEEMVPYLREKLNRPLRVCGMVINEGEPGGGPYWVRNSDGTTSLQIVEASQIDKTDAHQMELMKSSTHFNPVDLICSVRNYKGEKYDLTNYIDHNTGFISFKSQDGAALKALELPGLWNGAMSGWNTIFIEVAPSTFSPVKTVNDLLRPEHCPIK